MFTVHCPPSLLWHPAVHHSLLLLRALKQPHTLLLEAEREPAVRLPIPLLCDQHMRIKVSAPPQDARTPSGSSNVGGRLPSVYQPDHIPYLLQSSSRVSLLNHLLDKEMASYLDSVAVAQHILNTWDALAVAFNTGEMEMTRQMHAGLMDMVEQLEGSIEDEQGPHSSAGTATTPEQEAPLSTWPLFTTLEFLIEQGGLLTSAFPRLQHSYKDLSSKNRLVHQHRRLVRKTVAQLSSSPTSSSTSEGEGTVDMEPFAYPQHGLLMETQHRLNRYTTSVEESVSQGVSGERGPLNKRMSGGRMGMQTVAARVPWTRQNTPLKR